MTDTSHSQTSRAPGRTFGGFTFGLFGYRFRPTVGPTLFTIPMFLLLVALGTWQIHRLHWKEALIAERAERVSAPPMTAPPADSNPASIEYRHVKLTGHFLNDKEMYLAAREKKEGAIGYHILTPFADDSGKIVLVDRGYVPLDKKKPETREAAQYAGRVTVTGLIRKPDGPHWFLPDNEPKRNFWFYIDIPAMSHYLGISEMTPYYVDADATPNPGGYPLGGQTRLWLPNNHLQYVITWYALAIALLVIYLIYHRVDKP